MSGAVNRVIVQAPDNELLFDVKFEFSEISRAIREELAVYFNLTHHDDEATKLKKSTLYYNSFLDWVGRTVVRKDDAYLQAHKLDFLLVSRWELDGTDVSLHLTFQNKASAMLFKLTYC